MHACHGLRPSISARKWLLTGAATGVSMYAMDAVATLAGLLLVATGVLRRLDTAFVLLFVGASYLVWWAGLRVNLHANWALLEATGTSTNLLSKAAYELARLRRAGARLRRVSASAGYVASELAKEAPYYAGAFGAAAVSDGVSANDALIFLAGANLGAAAYEYGLGRGIVAFLRAGEMRATPPSTPTGCRGTISPNITRPSARTSAERSPSSSRP
jgi:hypothetical protein